MSRPARRHEKVVNTIRGVRRDRAKANAPPLTLVWLGPTRAMAKNYQMHMARLAPSLNEMWRRVEEKEPSLGLIVVDAFAVSHAVGIEHTSDGLHCKCRRLSYTPDCELYSEPTEFHPNSTARKTIENKPK